MTKFSDTLLWNGSEWYWQGREDRFKPDISLEKVPIPSARVGESIIIRRQIKNGSYTQRVVVGGIWNNAFVTENSLHLAEERFYNPRWIMYKSSCHGHYDVFTQECIIVEE